MNFKYMDNLPNIPDNQILMVIEAIGRRLARNIDDIDVRKSMAIMQESFMMEAEKRGLSYE